MLIASASFGFAQNKIHDLSKYGIELIVSWSSTNATKRARSTVSLCQSQTILSNQLLSETTILIEHPLKAS